MTVLLLTAAAGAQGTLLLSAEIEAAGENQPVALELLVDGQPYTLSRSGRLELQLEAGEHQLEPLGNAQIEGPRSVEIVEGQTSQAVFLVRPSVEVELSVEPELLREGESGTVTARAVTAFQATLPLDLAVILPPGLASSGVTRIKAPLSAASPRELSVEVTAARRGNWQVEAVAVGWDASASSRVEILRPAMLELSVEPLTPGAAVGDEIEFMVSVSNIGDETAAGVQLQGRLHPGMSGEELDTSLDLPAGESQRFRLVGVVLPAAAGDLQASATASLGPARVEATASARTLRPGPTLTRTPASRTVLVGETVQVRLSVGNEGDAPLRYGLVDNLPEWVEPLTAPEFAGTLDPGESAIHEYQAAVRFGADASGLFQAQLEHDGGTVVSEASLKRRMLPLELSLERDTVRLGGTVTATLRLVNPGDARVEVRLQGSPDAGLAASGLPDVVVLAAGEELLLPIELTPSRAGGARFEVTAFLDKLPLAFPQAAQLTVLEGLVARRTSSLSVPFYLQAGEGDEILIRHALPDGASYLPGSSSLSGGPLPDPSLSTDGKSSHLYWSLPFVPQGELTYSVTHDAPLPQLQGPAITLLGSGRELSLLGETSTSEAEAALTLRLGSTGMIRDPSPGAVVRDSDQISVVVHAPYPGPVSVSVNGKEIPQRNLGKGEFDEIAGEQRLEYFGVKLQPGRNALAVSANGQHEEVSVWLAGTPTLLRIRPLSLLADGREPLRFVIEALDGNGIENGFGAVTVTSDAPLRTPDAFPGEAGHQLLLQQGVAKLELEPFTSARRLAVAASFNELTTGGDFQAQGSRSLLLLAQASLGLTFGHEGRLVTGLGRAYLELPLGEGALQAALDSESPLMRGSSQSPRFPVTGAAGEARVALESVTGFAARYDDERLSLGYYHGQVELPALAESFEATAFRAETQFPLPGAALTGSGFVALVPSQEVSEELRPDGTRMYLLGHPVMPGTERVERLVSGREGQEIKLLRASIDYVVDHDGGILILTSPLWHTTPTFEQVRLRVTYAPAGEGPLELALGAGLNLDVESGWAFAMSAMQRGSLTVGATAGYGGEDGSFAVSYQRQGDERETLDAKGNLRAGPARLSASASYRPPDGTFEVDARLGLEVAPGARLLLGHVGSEAQQETDALIELEAGELAFGLGASFDWHAQVPYALGRLAWSREGVVTSLEHRQALTAGVPGVSGLQSTVALQPGLELQARLAYTGGVGLGGTLELVQKMGSGNVRLGYNLAGASAEGNRARFGIQAPFQLDENWSIDLSAGFERHIWDGSNEAATGMGVRYRADDLVATLAADLAVANGEGRLVFRGGASGIVDEQTTLSLDANFQVAPHLRGKATISHAYRDGEQSFLAYHRLALGERARVEGELAHTIHPDSWWQLRPAFAYRLPLAYPERALFQFSLGGNVYPLPRFGVGAALHRQFQPALLEGQTGVSLEAGYELVPGFWLNAGYTFGGFSGLTSGSSGFHLRLDGMGAWQR